MKKIIGGLVALFLFLFLTIPVFAKDNIVNLYLFYSESCPHCKDEIEFLQKIEPEYENLKTFFVYKDFSNVYKFYESYKYQRCEKKYDKMNT